MVTPYDRRLDRLPRWLFFLSCSIAWAILAQPLDTPTILGGNFLLTAAVLQSWSSGRSRAWPALIIGNRFIRHYWRATK